MSTENNNLKSNADAKLNYTGQFIQFVKGIFNIRKGTDINGTIFDIKENISIKGHTAYILVFSILLASIGLNVSSTAVVIGAMLISPLMGPILGVGLSIGINDIDTLKKSLHNLGVMVFLSVFTSFLFFSIPLFKEATPEILARTAPDVRDVFIAVAGGLALIVAISRRTEQTNTIAGVAIATALMPPLCTAGYGLATFNLSYFGGAMFLFTINGIFIALATFAIVKSLHFPMVKYINSTKRKRIARLASFVAIIILTGSVYLFLGLLKENQFKQAAHKLIVDIKESGISIIDEEEKNINFTNKTIKLVVYGHRLSNEQITYWNNKLPEYGLKNSNLVIHQGADNLEIVKEVENLKSLYSQNQSLISKKDDSINKQANLIANLTKQMELYGKVTLPLEQIGKEAKINYSALKGIEFNSSILTDFNKTDTTLVLTVFWDKKDRNYKPQRELLKKWLPERVSPMLIKIEEN